MKKRISYKLLSISVFIGLVSGFVVSLFRILIPKVMALISRLLAFGEKSFANGLIFLAVYLLIGFVVALCLEKEPMIGGSGIPQITGKLKGKLTYNPLSCLIYKLLGGILSIGSGLSLGREGPSVQIGGSIGEILADKFNLEKDDKKLMIIGSASSAIGSAFTAPLSAISFSIEELTKKTSRIDFLYITSTVVASSFVTSLLIGNRPAIDIKNSLNLDFESWLYLIVLGIIVGLSSLIFNKGILLGKKIYARLPISERLKSIIPFFITGIVLLFDSRLLGSGENFIGLSQNPNFSLMTLIYFYLFNFILILVAFCSGIPGGIFFPLLSLGALLGNIYGSFLFNMGLVGSNEIIIFSMLAMAGHFSAIVRAPITGMLLIIEMTGGGIDFFLPIIILNLISYLVAELVKNEPIYESLLNLMLKDK